MPRSPRTTWTHGRRCALLGASAAVVCLGAVLASCGAGDGEGYVATGAAGGPTPSSDTAVGPTGDVTLVPLQATPSGPGSSPASANPAARHGTSPGSTAAGTPRTGTPTGVGSSTAAPAGPTEGAGDGRSPSASPSAEGSPKPAALVWSEPVREATDRRWCEDVTLEFRNTGGSPVTSGTVVFGTHVIGALGIDWATVESTVGLPVPIDAGARPAETWTVCVDAWRVPLGMRVETRDVTVRWG
ncbi:hypothetical protein [Streptomyces sp. 351MFTsu5.1]|uniref:hypothetical protein n=1 Tax=Streptomyces sp. 351MFTsu5.1 TaxID=1172180 RepID=UPI0003A095F8|nr:hypothetical protein [Streptomyces sp. 351MFTsu5.1]